MYTECKIKMSCANTLHAMFLMRDSEREAIYFFLKSRLTQSDDLP